MAKFVYVTCITVKCQKKISADILSGTQDGPDSQGPARNALFQKERRAGTSV